MHQNLLPRKRFPRIGMGKIAPSTPVTLSPVPLPQTDPQDRLPPITCTLSDLRSGAITLTDGQPIVYVVLGAEGPECGHFLYAGMTGEICARWRRHFAQRRSGTAVSVFDSLLTRTPWAAQWRLIVADPAGYLPFVTARIVALRDQLIALLMLPDRLAQRLNILLDHPERWAVCSVIEWAMIALCEPLYNLKSNCYGPRNGRAARPLDLIRAFILLAERECQKYGGAA